MGNQSARGLNNPDTSVDKAARTANDVFPLEMVEWVATAFVDMPLRQQVSHGRSGAGIIFSIQNHHHRHHHYHYHYHYHYYHQCQRQRRYRCQYHCHCHRHRHRCKPPGAAAAAAAEATAERRPTRARIGLAPLTAASLAGRRCFR